MTTLATLRVNVSRDLRDPSNLTFSNDTVDDLINAALAEVGRIAPERFQEDIQPEENALSYQLRRIGVTMTVEAGDATANTITITSHGFTNGTAIRFQSITGGQGLIAGLTYYVVQITPDTFKVSPIISGSEVNFTTNITAGLINRVGLDDPLPEIEVSLVELWDSTTTPYEPICRFIPKSEERFNSSQSGWFVWGGYLYLTNPQAMLAVPQETMIRVWGYSPYRPVDSDGDNIGVTNELEWAMRVYCRVEALKRLNMDRDLYTQWQTHSGNTDISPAGLLNALSLAQDEWRRLERKLFILREAP